MMIFSVSAAAKAVSYTHLEEYAEKIRKAQSQGERLTLEKQRDAAVHKVDME